MTIQEIEAATPYVCGWSSDVCCSKLATALASGDVQQVAIAQRCVDTAAEVLYGLSGRRFGLCELTVRPCRTECCAPCDMAGPRWTPVLVGGQWTNVACGRCGDTCSCTKVCEVLLPGPIASVTEVKLDGVIVPPAEYRVDNARTLVRIGEGCWPTCQDMNLEDTEPGTWSVTYLRGLPVPAGGQNAFAELACELFKACDDDDKCRLPKRVTSISREGVSMVLDPMTFMTEGKTGLYAVDLWLHTVNPQARTRSAGVYSVDAPRVRRPG